MVGDKNISVITQDALKKDVSPDEYATYDRALTLSGYGRFHYNLVAACALCLLAAGFQNGLSAYVLPSAQCELHLTSAQIGIVNVSFLIGGCLSSFLWGILADTSLGRRNILIATLLTDAIVTMCTSFFANSFYFLTCMRMLNGFVIGAPGTLIFSYIGEFHTEKTRAKCICYVGFFFTLSWMLLPGIAWAVIPLPIKYELTSEITFSSWRLYMAIIGLFSLVASIWLCFLPVSPKLLLVRGHTARALKILTQIYTKNTRRSQLTYPVKVLLPEVDLKSATPGMSGKTGHVLNDILDKIRRLLRPPLLTYTSLTMFMLYANMFGYYGMGLWLPEFIKRFDDHYRVSNVTVRVCDLFEGCGEPVPTPQAFTMLVNSTNTTSVSKFFEYEFENIVQHTNASECDNTMEAQTFINTLIMGFVCLIGNILSGIIAGCFKSRRFLPIATAAIGGVTTAMIYWVTTTQQNVAIASICLTAFATGNMVINSVIVDIFPTSVSALAVCTATFAGRFGAVCCNLIFGLLLEISCKIPFFLVAAVVLASAVMGFLIPEGPTEKIFQNNKKTDVVNETSSHHI